MGMCEPAQCSLSPQHAPLKVVLSLCGQKMLGRCASHPNSFSFLWGAELEDVCLLCVQLDPFSFHWALLFGHNRLLLRKAAVVKAFPEPRGTSEQLLRVPHPPMLAQGFSRSDPVINF